MYGNRLNGNAADQSSSSHSQGLQRIIGAFDVFTEDVSRVICGSVVSWVPLDCVQLHVHPKNEYPDLCSS